VHIDEARVDVDRRRVPLNGPVDVSKLRIDACKVFAPIGKGRLEAGRRLQQGTAVAKPWASCGQLGEVYGGCMSSTGYCPVSRALPIQMTELLGCRL
jgi:hypothetical protein